MKRHWIEYTRTWERSPMTYWVHIESDGKPWGLAERFEPPAPKPVPGKGFPHYFVEVDGFVFRFASLNELDTCIETFGKRAMPTSLRLSDKRGTGYGPNNHWLSRLPKGIKSWRYREKAIGYLLNARVEFIKELGL